MKKIKSKIKPKPVLSPEDPKESIHYKLNDLKVAIKNQDQAQIDLDISSISYLVNKLQISS